VQTRQNAPHAETVVLPQDELAVRRNRKAAWPWFNVPRTEGTERTEQTESPPPLTVQQVQRLLVAAELRKRANQGE
jgi:hypothetical protein